MLPQLKKFWSTYVKQQSSTILKAVDSEKSKSIVTGFKSILGFKDLTDKISKEAFGNNEEMKNAQKDGFSDSFNSEVPSDLSSHYLAIFIHKMMQKEDPLSKNKQLVKDIRDTPFSLIIGVFRLLSSKDIFENFFTKYLGERLLHKKSASLDRELEFVGEIKNECG